MRSLLLRIGTVSTLVFFACGGSGDQQPGKTPSGARASCSNDAECVVTNEGGGNSACCAACPDAPRAIPQLAFEQHKNKCAATSCVAQSSTDRVECPVVEPVAHFVAKCKEGTCAAVKK